MSEERRKRQLERGTPQPGTRVVWHGIVIANPKLRDRLIWAGIVVVLIMAYAGFWYYNNHRYDEFAKCLASKQAKMYGLYWCPHCVDQKALFGKSFRYVPYVECAIKDSHELAAACTAAGVKLFPSWQFGANKPVEGVFPMQELSDKTGCSLP
jgi:glutaredoxin